MQKKIYVNGYLLSSYYVPDSAHYLNPHTTLGGRPL